MRAPVQLDAAVRAGARRSAPRRFATPTAEGFRRRFAIATLAGETAGFAVPALTGTVAVSAGAPDYATVLLAVSAGVGEGAILGYAQATAFRTELAGFDRRAFAAATAAAAAVAWACGTSLGAFGSELPTPVLIAAVAVAAPAILLSVAVGQWLVLRRYFAGATRWIPANAVAWLVGLIFPFGAMAALDEGSSTLTRTVVGVVSGFAMAAVVAAVTAARRHASS